MEPEANEGLLPKSKLPNVSGFLFMSPAGNHFIANPFCVEEINNPHFSQYLVHKDISTCF